MKNYCRLSQQVEQMHVSLYRCSLSVTRQSSLDVARQSSLDVSSMSRCSSACGDVASTSSGRAACTSAGGEEAGQYKKEIKESYKEEWEVEKILDYDESKTSAFTWFAGMAASLTMTRGSPWRA
ncbi:hypothetical protein FHG87_010782 [Trinorchestia longiramus]|nr:hypothetical protein FHG87_010782 [Trinorchestia longiramus]